MRFLTWLLLLPFRLIRRFATGVAVLLLVASLAFNVATLTVTGVFAAASTALSAVGISTVAAREAGEKLARRKAAQKIGQQTAQNVSRRVQRGAARNIASVGGEAIPLIGIGVIAGALALEVRDACNTAADMAGLEAALSTDETGADLEAVRQAAIDDFDCSDLIPDYDDLPGKAEILAGMKSAPSAAYEKAIAAGVDLAEFDWSGAAGTAVNTVMEWTESIGSHFENSDAGPIE